MTSTERKRVAPYYDAGGNFYFRADAAMCGSAQVISPRGERRSVTLYCLASDPNRVYYELDGTEHLLSDPEPRRSDPSEHSRIDPQARDPWIAIWRDLDASNSEGA